MRADKRAGSGLAARLAEAGLPWPRSKRGDQTARTRNAIWKFFFRAGTAHPKSGLPREGIGCGARISAGSAAGVSESTEGRLFSRLSWVAELVRGRSVAVLGAWRRYCRVHPRFALLLGRFGLPAPSGEAACAPRSGPHQRCIGPYECFFLLRPVPHSVAHSVTTQTTVPDHVPQPVPLTTGKKRFSCSRRARRLSIPTRKIRGRRDRSDANTDTRRKGDPRPGRASIRTIAAV